MIDVVAPGTMATTSFTVPRGKVFELANYDIARRAHSPTAVTGQVRLQILSSGASASTILVLTSLKTLERVGREAGSLSPPVTVRQGEQVALTVSCSNFQAYCGVTATISGLLGAASG
jgi:hypothetical protein